MAEPSNQNQREVFVAQEHFDIDSAKSDTVNFDVPARGIWVGVGGNVVVVTQSGLAITYAAQSGSVIPVLAYRVNSTSTTATGLIGLI